MLTEHAVRETAARRAKVLIPAIFGGLLGGFGCLLLVRASNGPTVNGVLILLGVAVFLASGVLAERYVKRFVLVCPSCSAEIARALQYVLATRRCRECGEQIVAGGRVHSDAAYRRQKRMESLRFLQYWLWLWPLLSCVTLGWHAIDPTAFARCPHVLFVSSLIGAVAGGWTLLRTGNRRYLAQTVVSSMLFVAGWVVFWRV